MSKLIFLCFKDSSLKSVYRNRIEEISRKLLPDNIDPVNSKIIEGDGILYSIVNPVNSVITTSGSVLLGKIFGNDLRWNTPQQNYPDGSYAIFRSDEKVVEIVSDVVASRSIWYYKNDEIFISSTSQRAIINFLGSLDFNKYIIPWMMSSGTLGPSHSWDSRIKFLEPDSSIILSRSSWELKKKTRKIEFQASSFSDKEYENSFKKALSETFTSLNLDFTKWILPLSGGYDSRGILCFLQYVGKNVTNLKAITWGLNESRNQKGNDAYVAKKLADHFKIDHQYYSTNISKESFDVVINRFLVCGEGRIDHIGGYLDGLNIWKALFETQIEGVIRGDVSFSSKPAESPAQIRKMQGIPLCTDFSNLKDYQSYGFEKQELPEELDQLPNENLAMWRDRLYHQFRMPVILAALNDLKVAYVEVINPLLSRKIVYLTRKLPNHLRSNKSLFKKIISSISPAIPYATSGATEDIRQVLRSLEIVQLFIEELSKDNSKEIFTSKFIDYVLENIKAQEYSHSFPLKNILKRFIPRSIINKVPKSSISKLDFNILAFRMYLVCKMRNILLDDLKINKPITTYLKQEEFSTINHN